MRAACKKYLVLIALLQMIFTFSQQNISGKIVDDDHNSMNAVLVFNSTKNIKAYSNISGYYSIEVILSELQTAFAEYSKLNKLSD